MCNRLPNASIGRLLNVVPYCSLSWIPCWPQTVGKIRGETEDYYLWWIINFNHSFFWRKRHQGCCLFWRSGWCGEEEWDDIYMGTAEMVVVPKIWQETVEQRTGLTQVPFHHSMPQSNSTVSWEMEQHCMPINHERSSLLFSQVLQDLSNSSGRGSAHPWQTTAALAYILYIIKNVMSALNKMSKWDKCGQCSKKVGLSSRENCT